MNDVMGLEFMSRNPLAPDPRSIPGFEIDQTESRPFTGDQEMALRQRVILDESVRAITPAHHKRFAAQVPMLDLRSIRLDLVKQRHNSMPFMVDFS